MSKRYLLRNLNVFFFGFITRPECVTLCRTYSSKSLYSAAVKSALFLATVLDLHGSERLYSNTSNSPRPFTGLKTIGLENGKTVRRISMTYLQGVSGQTSRTISRAIASNSGIKNHLFRWHLCRLR